jgi:hypothetical protein
MDAGALAFRRADAYRWKTDRLTHNLRRRPEPTVVVVGQFQKANFGEGVGSLGQRPDELGALFNKLLHATTPTLEKRTPALDVRRVNGTRQLTC